MRNILAPHRAQDGWVYVRARSGYTSHVQPVRILFDGQNWAKHKGVDAPDPTANVQVGYEDSAPHARIISSRRVEEAVETADYLKRCAEEGLDAVYGPTHFHLIDAGWTVGRPFTNSAPIPSAMTDNFEWVTARGAQGSCPSTHSTLPTLGHGPTLREAYFRFHADKNAVKP